MTFLDRAYNGAGPLRAFRKEQIMMYINGQEPTAEDFEVIADLTINSKHNIRSAVEAFDPSFKDSNKVPDGETVALAVEAALSKEGWTGDPTPIKWVSRVPID
jgi:hypothetical protein